MCYNVNSYSDQWVHKITGIKIKYSDVNYLYYSPNFYLKYLNLLILVKLLE